MIVSYKLKKMRIFTPVEHQKIRAIIDKRYFSCACDHARLFRYELKGRQPVKPFVYEKIYLLRPYVFYNF